MFRENSAGILNVCSASRLHFERDRGSRFAQNFERYTAQIEVGKGHVSIVLLLLRRLAPGDPQQPAAGLTPAPQRRARRSQPRAFSTFAIRVGTPNSLRQTSASTATPSRIS